MLHLGDAAVNTCTVHTQDATDTQDKADRAYTSDTQYTLILHNFAYVGSIYIIYSSQLPCGSTLYMYKQTYQLLYAVLQRVHWVLVTASMLIRVEIGSSSFSTAGGLSQHKFFLGSKSK